MRTDIDRCDSCGQFVRGCGLVHDEYHDLNICPTCEGRNSKVYRLAESVHEQLPDEAKDDIIDWLFDACVENGDPIELAQYYLDDKTEV